jgi:flavodoxin/NAD-dependent dihydropyrimidine dehydrogenase PreA subunit
MNTSIIYFSQSGNTRKTAQRLAVAFRKEHFSVRNIPLRKAAREDVTSCDLLGIGAPCFSSQAPTPVKNFLENLPSIKGIKSFVFATSGGAPGRVLYDLARLLKDRGSDVIGGFLSRGSLHHPAPCLNGRFPDRPDKEDLIRAEQFAHALAEHLRSGIAGPLPATREDVFRPGKGFYDLVGLISTDRFLRIMLPKPKLNSDKCNLCNWCVLQCPMNNISLREFPLIGKDCIRCYHCVTGCPNKAFTADWRFGNLAVLLFYNTIFERWFGDLEPDEQIYHTY